MDSLIYFISVTIKMFFLFAPFFGLSMFLCLTSAFSEPQKRKEAIKCIVASSILCGIFLFAGMPIFKLLGLTLDSFRVGVGTILLLNAIALSNGKALASPSTSTDIAVVPMAIPVLVGPAIIGVLMVISSELPSFTMKFVYWLATCIALSGVGVMFVMATRIEDKIGIKGLAILSKVTGLILASLAAQMIMKGLHNGVVVGD